MPAFGAVSPRVVCESAGTWTFDGRVVERGEGVCEYRVSIKSPEPAVPPKFGVAFSVPQDGEHHVWTADIGSHAGVRVDWQGL